MPFLTHIHKLILIRHHCFSDSGEKVSLSVTILLASTVFLLLVAEVMPPQSDVVPLVGRSLNV